MENKRIAVLSVLFNSDELLDKFFLSLSTQTNVDFTLFLLNNKVNEYTKPLVDQLCIKYDFTNEIIYIESDSNTGFAKGNNILIELALAKGFDYLLLSNNDIEFNQPGILFEMRNKCEADMIVTPKIYYYGSDKIWYNGGHINRLRALSIHENHLMEDNHEFDEERFVEFAPACFVMIHRKVFLDTGFFDENFFVYWEDTDFFMRAGAKGYQIKLLPHLEIQHKVSTITGGGESIFSTYYCNRNRIYFVNKHFKGLSYLSSACYMFLTTIAKLLIFPLKRKKALIQAIVDARKM